MRLDLEWLIMLEQVLCANSLVGHNIWCTNLATTEQYLCPCLYGTVKPYPPEIYIYVSSKCVMRFVWISHHVLRGCITIHAPRIYKYPFLWDHNWKGIYTLHCFYIFIIYSSKMYSLMSGSCIWTTLSKRIHYFAFPFFQIVISHVFMYSIGKTQHNW